MKIGILTYHFGTNYGGQLQCYALSKTLEAMGHSVQIINYLPSNVKPSLLNDLKQAVRMVRKNTNWSIFLSALLSLRYSFFQREKFSTFRAEKLNVGSLCNQNNFVSIYSDLDAIIVGSDQVWSPAHHQSGAYFLNFTPNFQGRRIAYAPCCAINHVEPRFRDTISNLLRHFSAISVRNIETKNFVYNLIHKEVPVVLDPTFLYSFTEFRSSRIPNGKYIIVYIIGEEIEGGHQKVIDTLLEVYNLPVYVISLTNGYTKYFSWATQIFYTLDPTDWVSFVRSATFMYTDSFHGTVFAMKYHVPFIAYYKEKSRASRFIDLKAEFNLQNIVDSSATVTADFVINSQPNFYMIDEHVSNLKEKSISFLKESLG